MPIYLEKKAQIKDLLFDKLFIKIFTKYSNYCNNFLAKNRIKFLKHIKINNHVIKLKKDKLLSLA